MPSDPTSLTDLTESIGKGQAAFNAVCALQAAAIGKGDAATIKSLGDKIQVLGNQLSQLYGKQIAGNAGAIAALNNQLDAVTAAAQSAENDLVSLTNVVNDVVTASKLLDGILSLIKTV
jgi:hypothetical protein